VALTIDVRSASSENEQRAVIAVITPAFSTDPMTRWAFPDPATSGHESNAGRTDAQLLNQ
jgi:hypothetical protein